MAASAFDNPESPWKAPWRLFQILAAFSHKLGRMAQSRLII
jgi:hypothetical protein